MSDDGAVYIVFAVVTIIWVGIAFALMMLHRRISRIEKELTDARSNDEE